MHRHVKTALAVLLVFYQLDAALALHSNDRYIDLPSLPISLWERVENQAVVNAATGDIRFIARVNNVSDSLLTRVTGHSLGGPVGPVAGFHGYIESRIGQ